jgi:uncharacterized membrane protein YhdT
MLEISFLVILIVSAAICFALTWSIGANDVANTVCVSVFPRFGLEFVTRLILFISLEHLLVRKYFQYDKHALSRGYLSF